ncbi:hypothetical protein ACRRTK_006258 [Alexandromys fortis]
MNGEMLTQGGSVMTEEQKLKAEAKANAGAWKRTAERIVRKGYRAPGRTPPRALRPGRQKAPPGGGSLHPGGGARGVCVRPGGGTGTKRLPLPSSWGLELNHEVENQPPRPHPGKPIQETDLLRDPDINAAQSKAAGSPPLPTLHVHPGTRRAGRAGGPLESGTAYHLPLDKVKGPSL